MRGTTAILMISVLLSGAAVLAAAPARDGAGPIIQLAQATVKPAASEKWYIAEPLSASVDVDTAYIRIKGEFGFNTLEQRLANTPGALGSAQALYNDGFAYDGQPGAYYLMRDRVLAPKRVLQVEVMKNGAGTTIEYAFATARIADVGSYNTELRRRILEVIQ